MIDTFVFEIRREKHCVSQKKRTTWSYVVFIAQREHGQTHGPLTCGNCLADVKNKNNVVLLLAQLPETNDKDLSASQQCYCEGGMMLANDDCRFSDG